MAEQGIRPAEIRMKTIQRIWSSLNYRYCMAQRYLYSNQGETLIAVMWERKAWEWKQSWNT